MKTVYQVFPKTKRCLKWIKENVYSESWQWIGQSLCIEHRFIQGIYKGLVESGYEINKDFEIK